MNSHPLFRLVSEVVGILPCKEITDNRMMMNTGVTAATIIFHIQLGARLHGRRARHLARRLHAGLGTVQQFSRRLKLGLVVARAARLVFLLAARIHARVRPCLRLCALQQCVLNAHDAAYVLARTPLRSAKVAALLERFDGGKDEKEEKREREKAYRYHGVFVSYPFQ